MVISSIFFSIRMNKSGLVKVLTKSRMQIHCICTRSFHKRLLWLPSKRGAEMSWKRRVCEAEMKRGIWWCEISGSGEKGFSKAVKRDQCNLHETSLQFESVLERVKKKKYPVAITFWVVSAVLKIQRTLDKIMNNRHKFSSP